MAMTFRFVVEVEVNHSEGKFVSKDEIADQLTEALTDADPGEVFVDESTYTVDHWEVME